MNQSSIRHRARLGARRNGDCPYCPIGNESKHAMLAKGDYPFVQIGNGRHSSLQTACGASYVARRLSDCPIVRLHDQVSVAPEQAALAKKSLDNMLLAS